jgi:hypothetical protein
MLWNPIIGAVYAGEADVVSPRTKGLDEALENAIPFQFRDVFHADDGGADPIDQVREAVEHAPLLVVPLALPPGVPRERLAWSAPHKDTGHVLRVGREQIRARHVGDISQNKLRIVICFKGKTAGGINIDPSSDGDTRPDEAMSESACSAEQVYSGYGVLLVLQKPSPVGAQKM